MNDALRTKLNLILTAGVAFAVGLGIAARLDLTPPGLARVADNPPLHLTVAEPAPVQDETLPLGGFSEIAERVTPAVVTIFVERTIEGHSQDGRALPPARLTTARRDEGDSVTRPNPADPWQAVRMAWATAART
jgi:hypothetical protein